jgi:hypothetical protein
MRPMRVRWWDVELLVRLPTAAYESKQKCTNKHKQGNAMHVILQRRSNSIDGRAKSGSKNHQSYVMGIAYSMCISAFDWTGQTGHVRYIYDITMKERT